MKLVQNGQIEILLLDVWQVKIKPVGKGNFVFNPQLPTLWEWRKQPNSLRYPKRHLSLKENQINPHEETDPL
ncbi:MAG: hypothetical protein KDE50_38575 [Caldilineaceae bacterium]|nr:hypothetical protein [Caldilineaceae bacterium]